VASGAQPRHIRAIICPPDGHLGSILDCTVTCQGKCQPPARRTGPLAGRDATRAEGFKRLDLGATLPGVPLYRAFGFEEIKRFVLTMPDGVRIEGVLMERPID
jgi:hypothetical protein